MNSKLLFAAVTALLTTAASSQAQDHLTQAKFKAADEKGMNSPTLDDSSWKTIDITRNWDAQGIPADTHVGWYRIHFRPERASLGKGSFNQYLILDLGPIDDTDKTYLNGVLVGQTGTMPEDPEGYQTKWDTPRRYIIPANHKALKWDDDNVIAIKCYSGNAPGGMFRTGATIRPAQLSDAASIKFTEEEGGKEGHTCIVALNSNTPGDISGVLTCEITDPETGAKISEISKKVKARSERPASVSFPYDNKKPVTVTTTFTEGKSGQSISASYTPKYILTPPAPASPRFNTAPIYGVRPGSPIHYRFGVSGERPMTFTATSLPEGVHMDPSTGVLSGKVANFGDYTFTVTAKNAKGEASQQFTLAAGDKIGLTPPMGWNSWNCWGLSVTQDRVKSSAQALIDKGLADYGYSYINIDDAWEAPERAADGTILVNEKFPDIKELGDWLHECGLKLGIYSSPGDLTCGGYLGSLGHEKQDAESYNDWGIDYLKYDWCGYSRKHVTEPDNTTVASYIRPYMLMGKYLREQPRDIFYSLCQYGMADVWEWGAFVDANSWRTTGDIVDTWPSVLEIGFKQQAPLSPYAEPGHWNDPDMLVVGKVGWSDNLRNSRLTPDEQYSHISLWSLLASNMLIGCDLAQLDDFTINLLCNNEVNAVNQDILGKQAKRVAENGDIQVWMRPLNDGTMAVGVFNLGDKPVKANLADYYPALSIKKADKIRDLWRQTDLDAANPSWIIPSHGVRFVKVTGR